MNQNKTLVDLAMSHQNCKQRALAEMLGVSQSQISQWKRGASMSDDMRLKLERLCRLESMDVRVVAWAGDSKSAKKWEALFARLGSAAYEKGQVGYRVPLLTQDSHRLAERTVCTLNALGVASPQFPVGSIHSKDESRHPVVRLVEVLYASVMDLSGFVKAFLEDLLYVENLGLGDQGREMEANLMNLAATKIDLDPALAPQAASFKAQVEKQYVAWLVGVKKAAVRSQIPLGAELMDLVGKSHEDIREVAKTQAMGLNDFRSHPDVYMNELLTHMRVFRKAMPQLFENAGLA